MLTARLEESDVAQLNKRLALAGGTTLLWINGLRLTMTNDGAYDFIVAVCTDKLETVDAIARVLRRKTRPRSP